MKSNTRFSHKVPSFHGRMLPEEGAIVGYAAIIETLKLPVPIPNKIAVIRVKPFASFKLNGSSISNGYQSINVEI